MLHIPLAGLPEWEDNRYAISAELSSFGMVRYEHWVPAILGEWQSHEGESMTAFENAAKFFVACEAPEAWAGCKPFVAEGASFTAQSEPLTEVKTVEAYCEWMYGFATVTAPGATYELQASAYDEKSRTAIFFANYHARHTGAGGPVPPTHKETHSHYVYFSTMNPGNRVERMVKVWNAPWAMRELGWV